MAANAVARLIPHLWNVYTDLLTVLDTEVLSACPKWSENSMALVCKLEFYTFSFPCMVSRTQEETESKTFLWLFQVFVYLFLLSHLWLVVHMLPSGLLTLYKVAARFIQSQYVWNQEVHFFLYQTCWLIRNFMH